MNRIDAARILGVSPAASPADVEAAWRKVARRTHPDAGGDAAAFDRAAAARRTLTSTPVRHPANVTVVHRRGPLAEAAGWLDRRLHPRPPRVL